MAQQLIQPIIVNELLGEVLKLKNAGYRMAAISCTNKEGLELTYSFDKDYEFLNLRLNISYEEEIESISSIYPFAFLYENEIKDLFGAHINNITVDFKGNLYQTAVKTPFNPSKNVEAKNLKVQI